MTYDDFFQSAFFSYRNPQSMISHNYQYHSYNKCKKELPFRESQSSSSILFYENNQPAAIILSPSESQRLSEIEEDYTLLLESTRRLKDDSSSTPSREELMSELYISEVDFAAAGGYGD